MYGKIVQTLLFLNLMWGLNDVAWAQICDPALQRTTPSSRFEVRRSGTVTDKLTGLTWMRCSLGQVWTGSSCLEQKQWYTWFDWIHARESVSQLEYAGYQDWRLPTREELQTLLELGCVEPSINLEAFPTTIPGYYWTETSDQNPNYAWRVDFTNGLVGSDLKASVSYRVRPVRGYFHGRQEADRGVSTVPTELERAARLAAMNDGIHDLNNDQLAMLQMPTEALTPLISTRHDSVNWVKALETGQITPRADLWGEAEQYVLDFNIVMAKTRAMPYVLFPHKAHTEWLSCDNCHPAIFIPKVGANPITMDKILLGEFCGRCHGRVAFSTFECDRCHQILHQDVPQTWLEQSQR